MKYFTIALFCLFNLGLFAQTVDASGKKQGYWKKRDEKTNKLIYEGLFKDNKPQGRFKYYYPNDTVKAIMDFKQDGKISYSTMFHSTSGKKMAYGKYIGENKDSVWTYYDDMGVLISRETYSQGKKNGKAFVYFPDGVVSEEFMYKNDLKNGPFKQYFDKNVVKAEGNYADGLIDGKASYYFPNGVTVATGYYKKGLKIGPWIYRTQDGKIKEKELYSQKGELMGAKETETFFNKNKPAEEKPKTENTDNKKGESKVKGTSTKTTTKKQVK